VSIDREVPTTRHAGHAVDGEAHPLIRVVRKEGAASR
jgi:hypothetical protein